MWSGLHVSIQRCDGRNDCKSRASSCTSMEVKARHGVVPNSYVKAEKDEDLDNYLHVPQGTESDANELGSLATSDRS